MRQPLSQEHRQIIAKLLRVEEHPVAGRILCPSTGGVETTLIAYMLCKYYEDNDDIELFFYTANLFEPPVEIHDRMEDEYNPFMNCLEGSTLLYRVREKTTKQFSHMIRYFTVIAYWVVLMGKSVVKCRKFSTKSFGTWSSTE